MPRPEFTELIARALMLLGSERAWVVHGADGIDEMSTTGYTKVSECRDGAVNTFYLHPADVGLPKAPAGALRGGDAHDNARIIERILAGERGAPRDVVLLNAGAVAVHRRRGGSVDDGMLQASRAIDRGRRQADARSAGRRSRSRVAEPSMIDRAQPICLRRSSPPPGASSKSGRSASRSRSWRERAAARSRRGGRFARRARDGRIA